MNSEISSVPVPASTLPALPVRRRETLEILDTALKLYRRYFWVLFGWSALVSCLALVPILNWFSFLTLPLLYGAVSCCVAAAVRGQSVKFSQCWAFSKPRYGSLLGTTLLSYLVLFGVYVVISIAALLVTLIGVWALSNAPQPLQITGIVIGALLGLIAFSVLMMVAFGWTSMVPIVVCLEDDKRSSAALGRAFELLKGNWMRVFGLSLILGLAVIAVFILVSAIYFLIGAGAASSIFSSNPSQSAIIGLMSTFAAFMSLFALIWNPAQSLIIAVLYLDLRVRREALDLEWTAYASTPVPTSSPAPVDFLTPTAVRNEIPFPATPASFAAAPASGSVEVAPPVPQPAANDFTSVFTSDEAPKAATPSNASSSSFAPSSVSPNPFTAGDVAPDVLTSSSNFSGNSAPSSVFPNAPAPDGTPTDLIPGSIFSAAAPDSAFSGNSVTVDPSPNFDSRSAFPDSGISNNPISGSTSPGAIGTNDNPTAHTAPSPDAVKTNAADRVLLDKKDVEVAPSGEERRD